MRGMRRRSVNDDVMLQLMVIYRLVQQKQQEDHDDDDHRFDNFQAAINGKEESVNFCPRLKGARRHVDKHGLAASKGFVSSPPFPMTCE